MQPAARLPNPTLAGMSRPSVATAPLDDDFLLEEILRRLPPQPSSLPRALLVCTRLRRLLSDPGFLRRFREHHHRRRNGLPPLLGFFDKPFRTEDPPIFNPTTRGRRDRIPPARFSSPWSHGEGWLFLGCRHGLALLISRTRREALVWDPLTGHRRRVAFPPGFSEEQGRFVVNAAVMCAATQDGHVHGDCRFTPFRLALVGGDQPRGYHGTHRFACLYDSESGVWGEIISVETTHSICYTNASVLVRNAFCWLLYGGGIPEFDFQSQSLAVIEKPADAHDTDFDWNFFVVRTQHSGLGLAVFYKSGYVSKSIQLWDWKSNCNGVFGWELQKTIQLDGLFSQGPTMGQSAVMMQGYDEDTNTIFLSTFFGDYMLQLESTEFINLFKVRRGRLSTRSYYPYRNFYITGSKVGGQDGGAEM